jgi:hypothetical protein
MKVVAMKESLTMQQTKQSTLATTLMRAAPAPTAQSATTGMQQHLRH